MGDPLDPLSPDFDPDAWQGKLRERGTPVGPVHLAASREVVVDPRSGLPRQAGADSPEGAWLMGMRLRGERNLFFFCKAILGLSRLTKTLHGAVCKKITHVPPRRKLILLPRDHFKTAIVSRGLPMHLLIQPEDGNRYALGRSGAATRILLAGEKAENAENQLGWIESRFESSWLIHALWPHRVWADPRREARRWNTHAMVLPRSEGEDFPEASIETIGVGGAITGRHYDVLVKDDLVSIEAANSAVVMAKAIEWHELSRALLDDPAGGLEVTIGTRWAVHDLYSHIIEEDPTVEVYKRSVIENGAPILPEYFPMEVVLRLQERHGVMFPLLYMNEAADPALTDFNLDRVRALELGGEWIEFEEDERDAALSGVLSAPPKHPSLDETQKYRGQRFTPELQGELLGQAGYLTSRTMQEGRPPVVPMRFRGDH